MKPKLHVSLLRKERQRSRKMFVHFLCTASPFGLRFSLALFLFLSLYASVVYPISCDAPVFCRNNNCIFTTYTSEHKYIKHFRGAFLWVTGNSVFMCNSLHENLVCICAFVEITINIIKHEWKNYRESKSQMDASNEKRNKNQTQTMFASQRLQLFRMRCIQLVRSLAIFFLILSETCLYSITPRKRHFPGHLKRVYKIVCLRYLFAN